MKQEEISTLARVDRYRKDLSIRSVLAYIDPSFPGLAVHRGIEYQHDVWFVTHLASGYTIYPFPLDTKRQAVSYARKAAKIADWTQRGEEDLVTSEIMHELLTIRKSVRKRN